MASALGVNRRTAERMRNVIALNFELEEQIDDRMKRFRVTGSLRRVYPRPKPSEVDALQAEVDARALERAARGGARKPAAQGEGRARRSREAQARSRS